MMLSFFRRNQYKEEELKRTGKDSSVAANKIDNQSDEETETSIQPILSIHPSWTLTKEQIYVYQFLNNDCPPLKKNQLGISGIEWEREDGKIRVSAFIRNSSAKPLKLGEHTLVMFDKNKRPLAKRKFHLGVLGELQPESSRPWHFYFKESDLLVDIDELPEEDWYMTFEIRRTPEKHTLDLPKEWEEGLSPNDKANLHKLVEQLPPLEEGELNLVGVDAMQDEEGYIHVVCLIRNGSDHEVRIDRLPLLFKDSSDEVVTKALIRLHDFVVKPNTSKPWRFHFPERINRRLDLKTWEIHLLQH